MLIFGSILTSRPNTMISENIKRVLCRPLVTLRRDLTGERNSLMFYSLPTLLPPAFALSVYGTLMTLLHKKWRFNSMMIFMINDPYEQWWALFFFSLLGQRCTNIAIIINLQNLLKLKTERIQWGSEWEKKSSQSNAVSLLCSVSVCVCVVCSIACTYPARLPASHGCVSVSACVSASERCNAEYHSVASHSERASAMSSLRWVDAVCAMIFGCC